MKTQIPTPDQYQEMRDALRDLCGRYDSAYWQKVDADFGYPEAFVDDLTKAGWLAAMITDVTLRANEACDRYALRTHPPSPMTCLASRPD